jgi:single-strand DNA-binding protein
MVNKVILIGNVGQDPVIRSTNDGREVASFSLATSENWTDKSTGEKKEKVEWHRVVVFSQGLVGIVADYVKKGTKLYVEGSLASRKWTDDKGIEKIKTEVVVQGFSTKIMVLNKKSQDNYDYSEQSKPTQQDFEQDDEIPF